MKHVIVLLIALKLAISVHATPPFALFQRGSSSDTTTADECAQVDGQLTVKKSNGKSYTPGSIHSCLCVSQLPQFVTENSVASSAVAAAGQATTIAALKDMIEESQSYEQCSYPEHSSPSCQSSNPCYFSCTDGYSLSKNGKSCQCSSPKRECNGKCGNYPSCNSRRASSNDLEGLLRREPGLLGSKKRDFGAMSVKEKRRVKEFLGKRIAMELGCQWGFEACGVFGGSRTAWECVDTANDLESCGGCMLPITPLLSTPSLDDLLTFGTDCTAIPGVADVACVRGTCEVSRCELGWTLSSDGTRCLKNASLNDTLA